MGVGVDLDAVQLLGRDLRREQLPTVEAHLLLQVEQLAQRDVEEVAAAAGGVQHVDARQLALEALQQGVQLVLPPGRDAGGGGRVALGDQGVGLRLHLVPSPPEGRHQHRLDDELDVLAAGVVGAELRALGGVEAALEEGAKDGGLDARPIEPADARQRAHTGAVELQRLRVVEEVPVEVADAVDAEPAARAHGREELLQLSLEGLGEALGVLDEQREDALGQEPGILGEEAEEQADEELGDLLAGGAVAVGAQQLRQPGELRRSFLGHLLGALGRAELLGVEESIAQHAQAGGFQQFVERELVDGLDGVGEVRVDADCGHVGDDQQRRILQGFAILQ